MFARLRRWVQDRPNREAKRKAEAEREAISKAGQDLYQHRLKSEQARRAAMNDRLCAELGRPAQSWRGR